MINNIFNYLLTHVPQYYMINLWHIIKEVLSLPPNKKVGRPTDNPKRHNVKARIDDETYHILDNYCRTNGKSKSEGIRDGIRKLDPNTKKV